MENLENLENKKILLICVTSQNVMTFRTGLIAALKARGFEVSVVAFDEEYKTEIEGLGVDFYCIPDSNRSMNPFKILSLQGKYEKLIKQIQPSTVFTFMLKPNTFGVQAARRAGVANIYSMVEGAGDAFVQDSLKWKIVRAVVCLLYRDAFRYAKRVFFLNEDDKAEFLSRELVTAVQCEQINGVGIDLNKFEFKPMQNQKNFLMVARMLQTKGIYEYCQAARLVKQKYPDAVFKYVGKEGDVTAENLREYIDENIIEYVGETRDVRPYYEECTANILPSWREGFGLVNAEAAAVGRPSITCDTIGTKETVRDGYNGFLTELKNPEELAEKIIYLIENPDEAKRMGENARKFAEECFAQEKINEKILSILEECNE